MSELSLSPTRRELIATAAAAGALGLLPATLRAATGDASIRPFRANVPQEEIVELRRRIAATRWPDRETVHDQAQGIQLAKIKSLAEYWGATMTGERRKRG